MQAVRGDVRNPHRYKQEVDFSGLLFERNITPTDVDGVLDFGGRFFVLIELKFQQAELTFGQRLCLERICDKLAVNSDCALLIARHNHPPEEKINAAIAVVSEFRWKGKWRTPKSIMTLRVIIDEFKDFLSKTTTQRDKIITLSFNESPEGPRIQSELQL